MPEQGGGVTEVLLSVSACSEKFNPRVANTCVERSGCAFEVQWISTNSWNEIGGPGKVTKPGRRTKNIECHIVRAERSKPQQKTAGTRSGHGTRCRNTSALGHCGLRGSAQAFLRKTRPRDLSGCYNVRTAKLRVFDC